MVESDWPKINWWMSLVKWRVYKSTWTCIQLYIQVYSAYNLHLDKRDLRTKKWYGEGSIGNENSKIFNHLISKSILDGILEILDDSMDSFIDTLDP